MNAFSMRVTAVALASALVTTGARADDHEPAAEAVESAGENSGVEGWSDTLHVDENPYGDVLGCSATGCCDDAGCCDEAGCGDDVCCDVVRCCGGDCCTPTFLAGVEASFIWADIDGFRGATTTRNVVDSITNTNTNDFADGDGFTATPRLWLTHVRDCWGFGVRYWNLSRGEHEVDVFFPPTDNLGTVGAGNLDAFTIDLLVEQYHGNDCRSQTLFAGVRHVDVEASQTLVQSERIRTTDTQIATSFSRYRVSGTGPTFGVVGRHRLRKNSCWNAFYRAGGSVLFGDTFVQSAASTLSDQGGTNVQDFDANFGDDDGTLFIAEFQLGLERTWELKCVPANAFFRVAGEYQYWDNSSDARAGASAASAITGSSTAAATATANDFQMDLFGVTIGTGLYW